MTLDPRIAAGIAALPEPMGRDRPPAERREAHRAGVASRAGTLASVLPPLPEERDIVVPTAGGGVPVRLYRPRPGRLPALIYLHGGAFWLGDLDGCDSLCRRRASGADCVVVSVDYRLAPEHPFPAALEDSFAVAQWLTEQADALNVDPDRIAISGISAGGNLAAAVTLQARTRGGPSFVAQVLEVPAPDLTLGQASVEEFGVGFGLSRADLEECVELYLGDHDPTDPLASPLHGDLHGLPPALITTAECDPLRDSGEEYAAKLEAAGVPVECRRWDGLAHGCGELDVLLPDISAEYTRALISYLREAFVLDASSVTEPREASR
jgi:acetyl esterase